MVDAAKSANVKVISYDRLILNSDVDLYISFDRVAIARMQAEYLLKNAPTGNYVLIAGSPNDEGAKALHDAQLHVLQPYIDRGDIKVVADLIADVVNVLGRADGTGFTVSGVPEVTRRSTLSERISSDATSAARLPVDWLSLETICTW